jgi:hypothetical protein
VYNHYHSVAGTQTDEPLLKSVAIGCRLLTDSSLAVPASVVLSSPSSVDHSSQVISSQVTDATFHPSMSEESQSDERSVV